VNTIAARTNRIPRVALIGIVALVAAFALLMVVRLGVLGGSNSGVNAVTTPPKTVVTPSVPKPSTAAKPKVVLLPDLPSQIASKLRYSKVVVVSVYLGQVPADRAAVAEMHKGARAAGAGFTAVNVANDKTAAELGSFVGPVSSPAMLVVRRPGKVVTQINGQVEAAVVMQAAHNAGARRR
jgi:hypothetical protein